MSRGRKIVPLTASDNVTIGGRIKILLFTREMGMNELADLIGVSKPSVSYWCSGKAVPSATAVQRICRELNVNANWLLGLGGSPYRR